MGLPSSLAQPWHDGERILQRKQGTVHTSDEMGPHIYHKVIPSSYRDMVGPQPQFMASFFDPETKALWASVIFAAPGFADCETSEGTHIKVKAALDPRDGAAVDGLVRPGIWVGAVSIDFMTRRRNRFNGVIEKVDKNGHFLIKITQAFGNCPKYITRRQIQRMGQNLEFSASAEAEVSSSIGAKASSVICRADMMYFGTGSEHGADMNIRGGSPGFVRVLNEKLICWPDYMGNGFYMSLGNVQLQKLGSLVFVDWDDHGHGVQVLGSVRTVERSEIDAASELAEVVAQEPQALRLVVLEVETVRFIPRYSPHLYQTVELSPYNPRPATAGAPEFLAVLQWVKEESKDVKTFEFQLAPLPRPGSLELKPGQHVRLALPALKAEKESLPERTWTVTSTPGWFADHGRFQISVKHKPGGLASSFLHELNPKDAEHARLHFLGFAGEFGPQLDASGQLRRRAPTNVVFLTAGIGSTPAVAAMKAMAETTPWPLTLSIFHSVRQLNEAAFLEFFISAVRILTDLGITTRMVLSLTGPDAARESKEFNAWLQAAGHAGLRAEAGRLSIEALKDLSTLQKDETEGFLCGPSSFEAAASEIWTAAGFHARALHTESFAY
ncbi:unnamed protein product [Durusdinium trenchii]|uniref:FAD-binding FR-type domain-containing protein n=2 Tax=Durusdinium trenchii TaxID=1381693 RepID=A0ABP0QNS8_9DINO